MVNNENKRISKELNKDVLAAVKGAESLKDTYELSKLQDLDLNISRLGLSVQYSHSFGHILDEHRDHPSVSPIVEYFAENIFY